MNPLASIVCRKGLIALGLLAAACASSPEAPAGDWPQILGPHRNGIAIGERLPDKFDPALAPKWTYRLGAGYSGPAVVGSRVVVFHRVGDQELVEALDVNSGKRLWSAASEANYRGGVDPDLGPRCVPVVHGHSVYAFGAAGDLLCVALESGKIRWRRSLYADYDADEGFFGAGSTPIVADGLLLVNVGGKNAGLVALELDTGKTAWQATSEAASYAAPTLATIGGQQRVIFVTRYNCLAVDPASGNVSSLFPFGKRGPTVNAATPLVIGERLFVTASYGIGAELHKLNASGTERVWANDDSLSSQYTTAVVHNGHLFGIHGREDVPPSALRCVELSTGKVKWSREFGVAHGILAEDKILLVEVEGRLVVIAADPASYHELSAHELGRGPVRALPALAGGNLYLRISGQRGELVCLPLAR
jgi:outer membrane protein assembly factor BamB